MSSDVIIDSFVVVVIGGLGSLVGAFVAAMVLGMIQALGSVYLPDIAALLPFALMVVVLIWKPAGFAGSRT
jgi:branched-chain amino acid transport system permease protein